jgi:outer membrane protein, multidrug efflux system
VAIAADYIALNKALGGGWSGLIDTGKPDVKNVDTGPHIVSNRQLMTNRQK